MTRTKLMDALAASDERRRTERAERIEWLSTNRLARPAVMDRVEASALLSEAEHCYIEGRFVATVLCAAAYVEQALIGELLDREVTTDTGLGIRSALRQAKEQHVLSEELTSRMGALADLRNSYAHLKSIEHELSFSARFMASKRHPDLIREEDARTALAVMDAVFQALLRPMTDADWMAGS